MRHWIVTHEMGIAGVVGKSGEQSIERHEVDSPSGLAAIHQVASGVNGWICGSDDPNDTLVSLNNPEAANASGEYCDYWLAEEVFDEADDTQY
jgi:hypothetical protein